MPAARVLLESEAALGRLAERGFRCFSGVRLGLTAADHVVVGSAGVLVVQVLWTDTRDQAAHARARAALAARAFRTRLQERDVPAEVVPAVLVCGPAPAELNRGVLVVDGVAMLSARQVEVWIGELDADVVDHTVLTAVADALAALGAETWPARRSDGVDSTSIRPRANSTTPVALASGR